MTKTTEAREIVLRLDGITKRFGSLTANDAVSVTLHRGEVIALLGENGAGKTTLMNILFGHYTADEGNVEVFGALGCPELGRLGCDHDLAGYPAVADRHDVEFRRPTTIATDDRSRRDRRRLSIARRRCGNRSATTSTPLIASTCGFASGTGTSSASTKTAWAKS